MTCCLPSQHQLVQIRFKFSSRSTITTYENDEVNIRNHFIAKPTEGVKIS